MKLLSVETTPNPNSMKLNLSEPFGNSGTFTQENQALASPVVRQLLRIPGIHSIFGAAAFLTLNRDPRMDWQPILQAAQGILSDGNEPASKSQAEPVKKQESIQVFVQTFREIPIQIKVTDHLTETRVGLPERFGQTARELQMRFGADYLKERQWIDWGIRYGDLAEVAQEVAEEIETLNDAATLERRKRSILGEPLAVSQSQKQAETPISQLNSGDWHERFQSIQQVEATEANLPLLIQGLHDEKPQIRRWVAARLATVKTSASVAALCKALLNDPHVGVRRTAGDSLSDIGDVSAQDAACQALADPNKLVRWRAARFLAEVGTEAALPFLEQVGNDPEYEVRLEIEAAAQHIRRGSQSIPVWKLMSQEVE